MEGNLIVYQSGVEFRFNYRLYGVCGTEIYKIMCSRCGGQISLTAEATPRYNYCFKKS